MTLNGRLSWDGEAFRKQIEVLILGSGPNSLANFSSGQLVAMLPYSELGN